MQQAQALRSLAQPNLPATQAVPSQLQAEATAAMPVGPDAVASYLDMASLDMLLFPQQAAELPPRGQVQHRPLPSRQLPTHLSPEYLQTQVQYGSGTLQGQVPFSPQTLQQAQILQGPGIQLPLQQQTHHDLGDPRTQM